MAAVETSKEAHHIEHNEALPDLKSDITGEHLEILAKDGAENEHNITPMQAVKAYPMALFWALMVSMCVVMEGYDTILIGNFYAYPTFARKYGSFSSSAGTYQLTAAWQAGLGNAAGVGSFFGVLGNGFLITRFGQKRTIIASLVVLTGFLAMTVFAPNKIVLLIGEFLCGLPWGVFASSAPAYASEVLPLALRVYLTSYTNMCFIMGQLIAAGVLAGLVGRTDQWGYRIPFALQWIWPVFLIPILFFAPESPWHLVRKGRLEDAEKSLRRLQRKSAPVDPKNTLATIIHTNQLELELSAGASYFDCFRGVERRRTEIACVAFAGQVLCGGNFANNATYFFQQVGLPSHETYNLNIGGTALGLVATFISWFVLMPNFGRRTIYVWGLVAMTITLFLIGILNIHTNDYTYGVTQSSLCLVWTFFFQLSVGQLGWALPAEVGSTRLRQKTVCLARNSYYIVAVIANVLQPYFMNPTEWNLTGYTGFVWAGTSFLTLIWAYFRLPESKGRTFEELDILFAQRVPAKKFATYEIDVFDEGVRLAAVEKAALK